MIQTIYIVEDNRFVREALVMLIEEEPDLEVCGVAATATDALEEILAISPDLVLADYSLPGMNGVELIERLRILKPLQRAAMLSAHVGPEYAEQAVAAGAKGFLLKGEPVAMMEGIRRLLVGEVREI